VTTFPPEPATADSTAGLAPAKGVRTASGPSGRNTPDALRALYRDRNLPWWPVLLFLPVRGVLSFLAQAFTALVLWSTGDPAPWESSRGWWTVYGTLTDAGCLIMLVVLLRREGLRLRDVFGLTRTNLGPQLRSIPLYLLALLPAVAAASLATLPFYGPGALPPQVTAIHLPAWAALYSCTVWPVVWAFTEEMVYLGFLLPRLQAVTGRTWKTAAVVVFFWSAQHLVIPFIPDGTYLISRMLGALLITTGLTLSFVLLRRRLLATTTVHWLSVASTAILATLFLTR
jgi:membrane protease YdiL (CAAX protease family)